MSVGLSDRLNLYILTGGRRQVAFKQVAEQAQSMGWDELARFCKECIDHESSLRRLKQAYTTQKHRRVPPRLQELDPQIDKTIGAICRIAGEVATALTPPAQQEATRLLEEVFPAGTRAITNLPYADQVHEVSSLLERLEDPQQLAPTVSALGLTAFVQRLRILNDEFSQVYHAEPEGGISVREVRAADADGQDNLLQVVAMILGRYPRRSEDHVAARTSLLTPILRQNDAVRAYIRARRRVRDVDPDNGKELPSEEDAELDLQADAQSDGASVMD